MEEVTRFLQCYSLANHMLFSPTDTSRYDYEYADGSRQLCFIPWRRPAADADGRSYSPDATVHDVALEGTLGSTNAPRTLAATRGPSQSPSRTTRGFNRANHMELFSVPVGKWSLLSPLSTASPFIPCIFSRSRRGSPLLVVHFHGTGGNIRQSNIWWSDGLLKLEGADVNILSVEYPGYGLFQGMPSESAIFQVCDRVMEFVLVELRVPLKQVIVSGRSMGSGPAMYVACEAERGGWRWRGEPPPSDRSGGAQHDGGLTAGRPPADQLSEDGSHSDILVEAEVDLSGLADGNLGGVVLISPFTSVVDVAKGQPGGGLAQLLFVDRFVNKDRIGHLRSPLLLLHGRRDPLIPFQQSQALFARCSARWKSIIEDPVGTHKELDVDQSLAVFCAVLAGNRPEGPLRISLPTYATDASAARNAEQFAQGRRAERVKALAICCFLLYLLLRKLGCSRRFGLSLLVIAGLVLPPKTRKLPTTLRAALLGVGCGVFLPWTSFASRRMSFVEASVTSVIAIQLLR